MCKTKIKAIYTGKTEQPQQTGQTEEPQEKSVEYREFGLKVKSVEY